MTPITKYIIKYIRYELLINLDFTPWLQII